jgi:predicted RNase H-like HicB family nuclease
MRTGNDEINIQYDETDSSFFIVWRPIYVIGTGSTETEALEDLREAAHLGIDTTIGEKLKEIS